MMIGNRWRPVFQCRDGLAALVVAGLVLGDPVAAQPSQHRAWCSNKDNAYTPDVVIGGCTAVIQSGKETRKNLAAAFNNRCLALNRKKEHERAIADCNQAIRFDPAYQNAFVNRGVAHYNMKYYERAIADYTEALRLDPKDAIALNDRGNVWRGKGDEDRAMADYDAAIRLNPDYSYPYNGRANVWRAKGDIDRALADYDQAIRLNPAYATAMVNRGAAWRIKGDHDRAIADYDVAIRLDPTDANAFNSRGNVYNDKQDYGRAIADFSTAIGLDPNAASAYRSRGYAYFYQSDFAAAASDLARAVARQPDQAYGAIWLYLARARAGDVGADAELETNAARFNPAEWPYPVAELYLGRRTAVATLAAPGKAGDSCEAQFYVGEWHLLKGDRAAARTALQLAVEMCPSTFIESLGALAELARLGP
jgi:tetratricopeptide (TPR) repeat protein